MGTLGVANGGTGAATFTIHGLLIGQTTSAFHATSAGTSGQIIASAGASTDPGWIDFPDAHMIPAANCNNTTAGAGWSIPASSAPTVACRTGTNVNTGVLEFTATSQTAQFQIPIPADWDTGTNPYARIFFTQGNANGSQTITMQMGTGCGATDDPSFNALQSFASATTGTTANTEYQETLSNFTMTGCSAGHIMNVKVNASSIGTNQAWVQGMTITFPRLIVVQAN